MANGKWLASRYHLLISRTHLNDLRGPQSSSASPSVQYVCGDKDEDEAKKSREGLSNNGPFRLS